MSIVGAMKPTRSVVRTRAVVHESLWTRAAEDVNRWEDVHDSSGDVTIVVLDDNECLDVLEYIPEDSWPVVHNWISVAKMNKINL